jgi:hypothetical protein
MTQSCVSVWPWPVEFELSIVEAVQICKSGGAPYVVVNEIWGTRWAVERPIAQHGEQDVAATPRERDEGLVVPLSLTDFAAVIGPGDRIAQSREGRQEHRALELLVSTSGGLLATNGRTGTPRDRRQPCVGRQMGRRREGTACDVDQESRCGPDPDSRHAGQDR